MAEHWTLQAPDGSCLYTVDSEEQARDWCHRDYGGAHVIKPMRVYTIDDIWSAERRGFENGIVRAANICNDLSNTVLHPTQTITARCEAAILAEIGEKP